LFLIKVINDSIYCDDKVKIYRSLKTGLLESLQFIPTIILKGLFLQKENLPVLEIYTICTIENSTILGLKFSWCPELCRCIGSHMVPVKSEEFTVLKVEKLLKQNAQCCEAQDKILH
jgi:hypothetical protein